MENIVTTGPWRFSSLESGNKVSCFIRLFVWREGIPQDIRYLTDISVRDLPNDGLEFGAYRFRVFLSPSSKWWDSGRLFHICHSYINLIIRRCIITCAFDKSSISEPKNTQMSQDCYCCATRLIFAQVSSFVCKTIVFSRTCRLIHSVDWRFTSQRRIPFVCSKRWFIKTVRKPLSIDFDSPRCSSYMRSSAVFFNSANCQTSSL